MAPSARIRFAAAVVALALPWALVTVSGRYGPPSPRPALAAEADDYLVQIRFALSNLDHQMAKLTQRAAGSDPLVRCSFGKRRREYYIARENLQALVDRARRSAREARLLKRKVESAFQAVQKAFEQALACYR